MLPCAADCLAPLVHCLDAADGHELSLLDDSSSVLHIGNGTRDDTVAEATLADSADQTGAFMWACGLILARWIATDESLREAIRDSIVLELGAGCGVPGLAAAVYARARQVVLTDLNAATLANLRANAAANRTTCPWCTIDVVELDWAECKPSTTVVPQVVFGADLTYSTEAVAHLGSVLRNILPSGGIFLYVTSADRFELAPELTRDAAFTLEREEHSLALPTLAEICCRRHPAATSPHATADAVAAEMCGSPVAECRTRPFVMQRFRKR